MIENPIIPGFNPDPSIIRVDDDYYVLTSTFEWTPGIQIHHSKDLKNWKLEGHVLNRNSQLYLEGIPPSCGIWAPDISYDKEDKLFYVCYSLVRSEKSGYFDLENYLVYSENILGPYSDPIYLNSSGFDPSLFHDDDGRKWVVNLEWDFRKGYEHPGSIVLQEYSKEEKKLIGESKSIYRGGTDRGCLEGPHIYKNKFYYIFAAEGGTGYGHCVTVSRSKSISGPYEIYSKNPIITSTKGNFNERGVPSFLKQKYYNPDSYLQKSGHGSLVQTKEGEYYMVHISSRPINGLRCMLGRETSLQKLIFTEDGWFKLDSEDNLAKRYIKEPEIEGYKFDKDKEKIYFNEDTLDVNLSSLRLNIDETFASLKLRKGYLRIRGQGSLFSLYKQSLIGRRLQSFNVKVETSLEFYPTKFQHMAGLVLFYNNSNFYYLREYFSEELGGVALGLMMSDNGNVSELKETRILINKGKIYLRGNIDYEKLQFSYSLDNINWSNIGPVLDSSKLSDEYNSGFTGAFAGICCQDLADYKKYCDFEYFEMINTL